MAEGWCTDTGEAVYRSRDAVKNLRIRVRIQRVTSTAALARHVQQMLSQQERGDIELDTFSSHTHSDSATDEEELVIAWQEKFFSQYEVDLYQTKSNCLTPLEQQYHTDITAMERSRRRQNQRIFTYTDFDHFVKYEEQAQSLLTPARSTPTLLQERMANVRHRRSEMGHGESSVPKSRLITWEPSEDFIKTSHNINAPLQTMYIMADLGPPGKLGLKENAHVLCILKANANGIMTMKPDFNYNRGAYRLETEGEKELWRLYIENMSPGIQPEDKEKEERMYRDLYSHHRDYLNSLVGQDFEMPPAGTLRLLVNGEIVSAQGFEYDNLFVHFFLDLPNSWSGLPLQSLSGVTQMCRTRSGGKEDVAAFCYPFSLEVFFHKEDESDESLPQWPVLYFKVLSLDFWQRYRTEGYGYLVLPSTPGCHKTTCHTWRPLHSSRSAELRRFFIGGAPELEDVTYVKVPGTFKGEKLSRLGFRTQTTGSVTFTLNCIQQARAFVDASTLKRRRQGVLDRLGTHSKQGSVYNVLEAFQRARKRMQEARDNLPKDLISTTAEPL